MAYTDHNQKIVDRILQTIDETKELPWQKPWDSPVAFPVNFKTKEPYSGVNALLGFAQQRESPYWLTYKQAQELGGNVRKGEKGLPCIKVGTFISKQEKQKAIQEGREPEGRQYLSSFTIFNAAQIDGIEFPSITRSNDFTPIQLAEIIAENAIEKIGCAIEHGYRKAAFSPRENKIIMPSKEAFHSPEEYYATLFHEIVHASGVPLGREMSVDDQEKYSKEELVAEIGSSFLRSQAGISDPDVEKNSAVYIRGWRNRISEDPALIVSAASQAQKAFVMIMDGVEMKMGIQQEPHYIEDDKEPVQDQDEGSPRPAFIKLENVKVGSNPTNGRPQIEYSIRDEKGISRRDIQQIFSDEAEGVRQYLDNTPNPNLGVRSVPVASLEAIHDLSVEEKPSLKQIISTPRPSVEHPEQQSEVEMEM